MFAIALVIAIASGSAQITDANRKLEMLRAYPDVILVNGKIHTIDASMSEAEALAIRSERIVAIGKTADIQSLAGPNTRVIDAKGRHVLPGLIDGHTHPNLWGAEHWMGAEGEATSKRYNDPQMKWSSVRGNNHAELLRALEQTLRQRAQEMGPGKWIVAKLFGGNTLPESRRIMQGLFASDGPKGPLTVQFLDVIAPNNPVQLYATEAIGQTESNSMAKKIMQDRLGYVATGIFARTVVPFEILLRDRWEDMADMLKREILECLSYQGVTTYGDRYDRSPAVLKAYNLLYQKNDMPIRHAYFSEGGSNTTSKFNNTAYNDVIIRLLNQEMIDIRGIGNDYIWNAGVANEGWEGGLSCTKATILPNSAVKAEQGDWSVADGIQPDCAKAIAYEEKKGYAAVKAGVENGLRIGFLHGYSDGTYDAIFNMLDGLVTSGKMTLEQIRALRISTEHNPIIRPDQAASFGKYNLYPSVNGYQIQGDIKGGAFLKAYGEQYMGWMLPVKSLANAGVHVVFNTDAHLGRNIPPQWKDMDYDKQWDGNIWAFMQFFASRVMPSSGVIYSKNEAIDKVTLIKAATIWGAEQLLNEKNIGSLEIGKLGDFIVMNKDYFATPDDQIGTVRALLTVVGGKETYRDPSY
ncbi:MAG: hypothetical protein A3F68_13035 [Acidobacteria bacterium RIFCSPLOWO2_12_FULL_54_10]|nr:MAG: hypothetical protein A3F68_13035 [Acidobacteria bacterium RIFCSPLOWO2_12_FULL_54_10]